MRNSLLIIIFILFLPAAAFSQGVKSQYEQNYRKELAQFRDSSRAHFSHYLQQRWDALRTFQGEKFPYRPLLPSQPIIDSLADTSSRQLPIGQIALRSIAPDTESVVDAIAYYSGRVVAFSYYGCPTSIQIPMGVEQLQLPNAKESSVSTFWNGLLAFDMDPLVRQLAKAKHTYRLNGWGLFDLVCQLSDKVFKSAPDCQVAFTVYVLNLMKYDIRMARADDHLVALLSCDCLLYDIPYTQISSKRYYAFQPGGDSREIAGPLYSYRKQLSGATRPVDMLIVQSPQLGGKMVTPPFKARLENCIFPVQVHQGLMDFYANYPQMELASYSRAAVDEVVFMALERGLKPALSTNSHQSVASLLKFVQESFQYQTDDSQHQQQKTYFCEENFYYPANDCEDRSLLFSYLVRTFVGLDVVLVDFSDHVATAVRFPSGQEIKGDYYQLKGQRYIVCDPTCRNARVGQLSPQYRNRSPKIIPTT